MSGGRKAPCGAFVQMPCEWTPHPTRLVGGSCGACGEAHGPYDGEGNKCSGYQRAINPMPKKDLEVLVWEHTRLNVNQQSDQELVGYIMNAMRALEKAHGIK